MQIRVTEVTVLARFPTLSEKEVYYSFVVTFYK